MNLSLINIILQGHTLSQIHNRLYQDYSQKEPFVSAPLYKSFIILINIKMFYLLKFEIKTGNNFTIFEAWAGTCVEPDTFSKLTGCLLQMREFQSSCRDLNLYWFGARYL